MFANSQNRAGGCSSNSTPSSWFKNNSIQDRRANDIFFVSGKYEGDARNTASSSKMQISSRPRTYVPPVVILTAHH
jgi:hypothetical protein